MVVQEQQDIHSPPMEHLLNCSYNHVYQEVFRSGRENKGTEEDSGERAEEQTGTQVEHRHPFVRVMRLRMTCGSGTHNKRNG